MFGVSFEHFVILAVVLLIFGPRRLPELGHTLGKAIRNFKEAISGVEEARFKKLESLGETNKTSVELSAPTPQLPVASASPHHQPQADAGPPHQV